jgi:deoxyribodipyrimidine photo-lyase
MKSWSNRARLLNDIAYQQGLVVYWMNRDQRIDDNWAVLEAQHWAKQFHVPLVIVFTFNPALTESKDAILNRPNVWMKEGLSLVQQSCIKLNIPFVMVSGNPEHVLPSLLKEIQAGLLITDFSPLRNMRQAREFLARQLLIPMMEVDAHNVCPAFFISDKVEWGAYTLRPKIHRALSTYLIDFPSVSKQTLNWKYDGKTINATLPSKSQTFNPMKALHEFIDQRLSNYEKRNDPNEEATSRLSAYLHFGQLSAQRIALAVQQSKKPSESFLEELIVRKELADNFCLYQPLYDQVEGFPAWAKKTLLAHQQDRREYLYDEATLTKGKTHDDAWNAAQIQMVKTGYMHGYMRMYWAKKILEWTPSPAQALAIANHLNDTYELDGNDPNGYVGTAWAIGGVHDRPWAERPIFGMIRFMNAQGLKRKFDIGLYVRTWLNEGLGL